MDLFRRSHTWNAYEDTSRSRRPLKQSIEVSTISLGNISGRVAQQFFALLSLEILFLASDHSFFNWPYLSEAIHRRQYALKISLAASFSFLFPSTSCPVHFSNCSPSLSYFRPPL